ncbi:MAG TPA: thiamine pyrophosphate-binding protein, partial [Galbitalea sp.]
MIEQQPDEKVVDRFVEALVDNGTEYLFLNPGTDTAPLLEAIAGRNARSLRSPTVVLCVHEAVALAAAHGYFMVSGKPQVVVVHVDVGTQNLGAMLHNVWRSEIGVVIFAGRTPVISTGSVPGMRDLPVHWQQDVPDQDGIVRQYAKSTVELRVPELIDQQVNRAFQLALATPPGAAYLTAGREALMAPVAGARRQLPSSGSVPARYAPEDATTAEFARLLTNASRPVLTTTRVGREPGAVAELVALAELLGAPVVDRRERMNFPSDHPLYLRNASDSRRAMEDADLIVVIDSDVPWVPSRVHPAADARVVHIGTDPIRADSPNWDFPSELTIQSEPLHALRATNAALAGNPLREHWFTPSASSTPLEPADDAPISSREVFEALDDLLAPNDIVVEEVTTNGDAMREHLARTLPGTHFQSGGSGLGWSLGASVGAKIARPRSRVVAVVGDG